MMAETRKQDRPASWWQTTELGLIFNVGGPSTITVHEPADDTVDTGLLDKDGRPIHRSVRRAVGFIDFGQR